MEGAGQRQGAVLLGVVRIPTRTRQSEVVLRPPLCRHDRGPPLVHDVRNPHRPENLLRCIGIDQCERRPRGCLRLHVGEPLPLIPRCGNSRGQPLVVHARTPTLPLAATSAAFTGARST
jgi:hypothetical protein